MGKKDSIGFPVLGGKVSIGPSDGFGKASIGLPGLAGKVLIGPQDRVVCL